MAKAAKPRSAAYLARPQVIRVILRAVYPTTDRLMGGQPPANIRLESETCIGIRAPSGPASGILCQNREFATSSRTPAMGIPARKPPAGARSGQEPEGGPIGP